MSEKFPKPWQVEATGQDDFVIFDANGIKLFYICADNPEDDEHIKPGEPCGPTILGYGTDEDDEALRAALEDMLDSK